MLMPQQMQPMPSSILYGAFCWLSSLHCIWIVLTPRSRSFDGNPSWNFDVLLHEVFSSKVWPFEGTGREAGKLKDLTMPSLEDLEAQTCRNQHLLAAMTDVQQSAKPDWPPFSSSLLSDVLWFNRESVSRKVEAKVKERCGFSRCFIFL